MNAGANTSTQIIIWLGLIIVSGIGLYWFVFHFSNAQSLFESINNDVLVISMKLNQNCDSNYYFFTYNPETEQGILAISKNELCIENDSIKKCTALYCGPDSNTEIDLSKVTIVGGERSEKLRFFGQ